MAMDASWDNSGLPPQKKGMPLWVKILGGCGILVVLLIGSCVGFGMWTFHKVANLGRAQWPRYVETVKALETPDGTKAIYEANPGLAKRFSDEAAFEQQISEWRPAIQDPPAEMPSLSSGQAFAFEGRNHSFGPGSQDSAKTSVAGYKMQDGRMLAIVWRDDKIVEVQFDQRKGRTGFQTDSN